MFPFNFQLSGNNSGLCDRNVRVMVDMQWSCVWATVASFAASSDEARSQKNPGFVRIRWNLNMMKLDC